MLATPVVEKPCCAYTNSIAGTIEALVRDNVRYHLRQLQGCCHVDDARNYLIRDFLQSECTDLFFIDADMGWIPNNVLRALKAPGDIVAGIYCHKGDKETYPFHPFSGETRQNDFGLFEMPKAATGFMRIRRNVVEALYEREKAKGRLIWLDGDNEQQNRLPVARICERGFVRELGLEGLSANEASQSGDYVLCLKARQLGFKVFTDPEMWFSHSGEKVWSGHFANHLRHQQEKWRPSFIEAVGELRSGKTTSDVFQKLAGGYGQPGWPLFSEALEELYAQALNTSGDVIETGSGLSTLVLGLALAGTDRHVHALEHDAHYWRFTKRMLEEHGVTNVVLHYVPLEPLEDGTSVYALDGVNLPSAFGLAMLDGPPARYNGRLKATEILSPRLRDAVVIVDDIEGLPDLPGCLPEHGFEMRRGPRQWAVARPRQVMAEAAE
jgi:predicted O-methyltransferase YrrM